jgi:hypothetical protein
MNPQNACYAFFNAWHSLDVFAPFCQRRQYIRAEDINLKLQDIVLLVAVYTAAYGRLDEQEAV